MALGAVVAAGTAVAAGAAVGAGAEVAAGALVGLGVAVAADPQATTNNRSSIMDVNIVAHEFLGQR